MEKFRCDKCNKDLETKEALDMHNKSKHPETYKEPWLSNKQKKRVRNYAIIFFSLLVIVALYYWRATPPRNAPIIEIEPSSYDFGLVKQSEGGVTGMMTITNTGNRDLILKNMETSCGCTFASVVNKKGIEGPRFGMASHGTNPKNWREVIKPAESVQLKVYYDPNVHKDLRGPVKRSISLYSNAPRNSVKEVVISANQVE